MARGHAASKRPGWRGYGPLSPPKATHPESAAFPRSCRPCARRGATCGRSLPGRRAQARQAAGGSLGCRVREAEAGGGRGRRRHTRGDGAEAARRRRAEEEEQAGGSLAMSSPCWMLCFDKHAVPRGRRSPRVLLGPQSMCADSATGRRSPGASELATPPAPQLWRTRTADLPSRAEPWLCVRPLRAQDGRTAVFAEQTSRTECWTSGCRGEPRLKGTFGQSPGGDGGPRLGALRGGQCSRQWGQQLGSPVRGPW